MATGFLLLLVHCILFIEGFVFPGPDDDPLIATVDFSKKLVVFNPSSGSGARILEDINLIGRKVGATTALDINYRAKEIYWSDLFSGKIYKMKLGRRRPVQRIITKNYRFNSPEGLAYDWIHDNLYVGDWTNGTISVVNHTTGDMKTIIQIRRVRDVEVDPANGWLYYIAGRDESAALYKSALNGENITIVSSDIEKPNSISLDIEEQRIYWTETHPNNSIYSIGVNGEDPRLVYEAPKDFDSIPKYVTVSRENLYFTQIFDNWVFGMSKHNDTQPIKYRNIILYNDWHSQDNLFMDIKVIDPLKQKDSVNLCGSNKGGCSHFCLPSVVGLTPAFTCVCPDDQALMPDNKTCTSLN